MWIKIVIEHMGPSTLVAYRVLFGLLFALLLVLYTRESLTKPLKSWVPVLVLGITNIAIPMFLVSWGEKSIDSGLAAILNSTTPLFSIIGAHFILVDDRMTFNKVAGILMGFAGVIVLMSGEIGRGSGSIIAQIALVVAAAFYAGSGIYARKYTKNASNVFRTIGPLISSTAIMWFIAFATEAPVHAPSTYMAWIGLLWLGVLNSGLALLLLYYLIHEIGPTRSSMTTYLFPLGGVTLGVIFLGEPLTWQIVVGATLITSSLVVANWQTIRSASS